MPAIFRICLSLSVIAAASTGCTSVKSIQMLRNPFTNKSDRIKSNGVPNTLAVPFQLKVEIRDVRWVNDAGEYLLLPGTTTQLVTYDVDYQLISKDELFTTDFKRPFSGSLAYGATLANQNFTAVNTKVEDKTIEDIGNVLSNFLGFLPSFISGFRASELPAEVSGYHPVPTLRAVEVFNIDDCAFVTNVEAFLERYLNSCNECRTSNPLPALE